MPDDKLTLRQMVERHPHFLVALLMHRLGVTELTVTEAEMDTLLEDLGGIMFKPTSPAETEWTLTKVDKKTGIALAREAIEAIILRQMTLRNN